MDARTLTEPAGQLASAGVLVAVDTIWASDLSWAEAAPMLAGDLTTVAILDSIATIPAGDPATSGRLLRSVLVEQLAVLATVLADLSGLTGTHVNEESYVLTGTLGPENGISVTVAGALCGANGHELELSVVGTQQRWRARFSADAAAAPATVASWDAAGQHTFPLRYESPSRATWLNVHNAVRTGSGLKYGANDLIAWLAIAGRALGPAG